MTQVVLYSTISSIIAGLLVELFFQLVKYRDSLNTESPRPVTAYGNLVDASNYMSVSQYLSGGTRKWANYFLFRLLPPFIIFILLAGVLSRYFGAMDYLLYTTIAAITSLLFRDLSQLFKTNLISEKLLHITNVILVLLLACAVGYLARQANLSFVAPSIGGLIDNLWSSLIIAMLVLFYFKVTNMHTKHQDQYAEEIAISNYIVHSYTDIKSKYAQVIDEVCRKNLCSKQILYAILIHENMNRPVWMRAIENAIVRLFKIELTVGIAQVRSTKALTDTASIHKAAKILAESIYADSGYGDGFANISQLKGVLMNYNSSDRYAESVSLIISKLRIYANELF